MLQQLHILSRRRDKPRRTSEYLHLSKFQAKHRCSPSLPHENEVIYVKQEDDRYAIKIGDGVTPLIDLPYVVNYSEIKQLTECINNAAAQAEDAANRAETAAAILESYAIAEEASF